MLKQLQDKVGRLQTQSNLKQSEFIKKKQEYEQVIQDLQNENERLRKCIEENSQSLSSSLVQSHIKASKIHKIIESPAKNIKNNLNATSEHQQIQQSIDLLNNENKYLKKELCELTRTYQKQIDQMKDYFAIIKQAFVGRTCKQTNSDQNSQMAGLLKAYESLLDDFQSQKNKYIGKIEELTNYIIKYQQRQKQGEQKVRKLLIDLQIAKEQLRIYKRSKMVKL